LMPRRVERRSAVRERRQSPRLAAPLPPVEPPPMVEPPAAPPMPEPPPLPLAVESDTSRDGSSLKLIGRNAARAAERELMLRMLHRTRWNRKEAAQMLGISYKALLYKIKEHRLDDPLTDPVPGARD
jgi:DNA-binding NtrC family response regulator